MSEKTEYRLSAEVQVKMQELVELLAKETGFQATHIDFIDHEHESDIMEMLSVGFILQKHFKPEVKSKWFNRAEKVGKLQVSMTSFYDRPTTPSEEA